jgi:hypothetical protein
VASANPVSESEYTGIFGGYPTSGINLQFGLKTRAIFHIDLPVADMYDLVIDSIFISVDQPTVRYVSGDFCIFALTRGEDTKSISFLFFYVIQ